MCLSKACINSYNEAMDEEIYDTSDKSVAYSDTAVVIGPSPDWNGMVDGHDDESG